jgi:hypothetical protein
VHPEKLPRAPAATQFVMMASALPTSVRNVIAIASTIATTTPARTSISDVVAPRCPRRWPAGAGHSCRQAA